MKVFHFYSGNRYGGIEVLLQQLQSMKHLCPQMIPQFGLCFEGLLSEKLRALGADLSVVGGVRLSRPWSLLRAQVALGSALKKKKPDLILCHDLWPFAVGAPVARMLSIPLVVWHHNPASGYSLENIVRLMKPDLSLACSRYVAATIAHLARPGRVKVCYTPIPSPDAQYQSKREEVRRRMRIEPNEVTVLHVGRLSAYKGQMELVRASAGLKDLPVRFYFVGKPQTDDEKDFLEKLKSECGKLGTADRVMFLGYVEDVHELYAAADIYCQPNPSPEPYGLSFIEALYFGLPVVATNTGGSAEIMEGGRYGILVAPRDQEALTQALRELIHNQDARHRYRKTGPERALELSDPTRALSRLHEALREVC